MNRVTWLAGVATGAAVLLAVRAGSIEVDPNSFQGRTEAAVREFREAVQLEPDLAHGAELFKGCASCHQADGSGSEDGTIPLIAGQHVSVLVKQLVDFRHDRRWHARMREAAKQHDLGGAQDILDVASYTAGLRRPPPRQGGMGDGKALHEDRWSITANVPPAMAGSARATCVPCDLGSRGSIISTCSSSSTTRRRSPGPAWMRTT